MRDTPRLHSSLIRFLVVMCLALAVGWPDWRASVGAQSPSGVGYEPPTCNCPGVNAEGGSAISLTEGNLSDIYQVTTVRSAFGATLNVALFYNSANADGSRVAAELGLGLGWTHSYLTFFFTQTAQPDALFRLGADGRTTRFKPNGDGTYSPNSGYFETLTANLDGSYTVREKDGATWTFAPVPGPPLSPPFDTTTVYRLIRATDRVGNATTLTYSDGVLTTISDVFSRSVQLAYDSARRLQSISDPASRVTTFVYDAAGDLHAITDPEGYTRTYTYNSAHQLTEKVERDGRRFTYSYDAGKPVTIRDEQGDAIFTLSNPTNWATDPNALAINLSREYVPSTTTKGDGNGHAWQHSYDINGFLTQTAAPDSAATVYAYDTVTLQLAAFTDANNHTTSYTYDALGNRTSTTNALTHLTTYTYEPVFNQLASMTDPNGRITTYEYDATGNRVREVDALGGVRRWTYDARGNVLSMTDQRGNVTRYQYDALGNRVKMIDPLGRATTYSYDLVGNLLTETDPNLHTTTYEYDGLDRRIRETDALGNAADTAYDGEGHVVRVTDRNLHATQFEYDSRGRRILTIDPALQASTIEYDGNDNVVAETDAGGHRTKYIYDVRNRLIATTDPLNQASGRTYDAVGNVLSETDANSHTTEYTYDALNRRRTRTDAEGALTEWRYDVVGPCAECTGPTRGSSLATQATDGTGKLTYFKYDGLDRLTREIRKEGDVADSEDASDAVTRYGFDAASNQITVTDPVGQTTAMVYDKLNRQSLEQNALGEVTRSTYDKTGNLQQVTAPNGNVTRFVYDAADRVIRVSDGGGVIRATTYDPEGNSVTETNGVGARTHFAYDVLDRLIARTDPRGQVTTYAYDPDGNPVETVDREGRRLSYTYDGVHRRTRTRDEGAPGKPLVVRDTQYQFDAVGNLIQVTDANGQSTGYTYDDVNRRVTETYPEAALNVLTFTYDGVGKLTSRTDQAGRTTTYSYNDLHFLVRRDYQIDPDDLFTYDPAGRVLSADRGGWQVTFAYDAANRLVESVQNGQRMRRGYDIAGRTRQLTYPGGRVLTEVLDARGRKTAVREGSTTLASFTFDSADRVRTRRYLNGVTTTVTNDANDRPTRLLDRRGTATLLWLEYGYDREGNKLFERHRHDPADSEAYRYDGVHQLVDRKVGTLLGTTVPSPRTQTAYSLDLLGNWNEKTVDGATEVRAHNSINEITAIDTTVVLHDDAGNLTNDGTRAYTYDEENRLVGVTRVADGAVLGEYQYDALGRRVRKVEPQTGVETRYFYDGWRVVEEQDATGATRATYIHGNYIDEVLAMDRAGQRLYYHHSALYSVSALSNGSGVLVEGYRYDAYGRQTVYTPGANGVVTFGGDDVIFVGGVSSVGNPYLFTGRELDGETGLMHYRARTHNPLLGRFQQRDPIGYDGGMNLYEYTGSRPTYFVDPLGLLTATNVAAPAGAPAAGVTAAGYNFYFAFGEYQQDNYILQQVAVDIECWDKDGAVVFHEDVNYQEVFYTGRAAGDKPAVDWHSLDFTRDLPVKPCKCYGQKSFTARECNGIKSTFGGGTDVSAKFRSYAPGDPGSGQMLGNTSEGTRDGKEVKPKTRLSCLGQVGTAITYVERYDWESGATACKNKPACVGTNSQGASYAEEPIRGDVSVIFVPEK